MIPLTRPQIPALFITGTDTGVGKTLVTAAIAEALIQRGVRVAVLKPIATGCEPRGAELFSEDAHFLARAARAPQLDASICPVRYVEPLAPAVAAERAGRPIDWAAIATAQTRLESTAEILLIEGVGGILVPLDSQHTVLDLASALRVPTIIVARAGLGTINHTLLTLQALRSRQIPIAGIILNGRSPSPDLAERTNPSALQRWAAADILCSIPLSPRANEFPLP